MTSSNGNIFRVTGHLCRNSPIPVNSPHKGQWRGTLIFFDLSLNKRLSKQSRGWWFETQSRPLRRHCNGANWSCYSVTNEMLSPNEPIGKYYNYVRLNFHFCWMKVHDEILLTEYEKSWFWISNKIWLHKFWERMILKYMNCCSILCSHDLNIPNGHITWQ